MTSYLVQESHPYVCDRGQRQGKSRTTGNYWVTIERGPAIYFRLGKHTSDKEKERTLIGQDLESHM